MAGKIGRELKKLSKGALVVPQIYALDPAGMSVKHQCRFFNLLSFRTWLWKPLDRRFRRNYKKWCRVRPNHSHRQRKARISESCWHNRLLPERRFSSSRLWGWNVFSRTSVQFNALLSRSCMALLSAERERPDIHACSQMRLLGRLFGQQIVLSWRYWIHGLWRWLEVAEFNKKFKF